MPMKVGKLRLVQLAILAYLAAALYSNWPLLHHALWPPKIAASIAVLPSAAPQWSGRPLQGFEGAPIPEEILAAMDLPPRESRLPDDPPPSPEALIHHYEQLFYKLGCKTRAYARMRAQAQVQAPFAAIRTAYLDARRLGQWADARRLLEEALSKTPHDDRATWLLILTELVSVLREMDETAAARARAREASAVCEAMAEITIDEMNEHPEYLAFMRKKGRDPVAELKKGKAESQEKWTWYAEAKKPLPPDEELKQRATEARTKLADAPQFAEIISRAARGEKPDRDAVRNALDRSKRGSR